MTATQGEDAGSTVLPWIGETLRRSYELVKEGAYVDNP